MDHATEAPPGQSTAGLGWASRSGGGTSGSTASIRARATPRSARSSSSARGASPATRPRRTRPSKTLAGRITDRYNRAALTQAILKPSAKIAQGFETQKFATLSGLVVEGFVVRETGDEVEFRNASGTVTVLPKSEIDERGKSDTSVMPTGLRDRRSTHDLASQLVYLESLKEK
jgi:putative heme-binding domain-containing protein